MSEKNDKRVLQSDLVQRNLALEEQAHQANLSKTKVLMVILGVQSCAIALLVWLAFFHFPVSQVVATSNAAAVCNVAPVDEPFIHHQTVADFAVDAAIGIYTYDHVNYFRQITSMTNKYFTPEYRDQFMVAFGDSTNLQAVIENFYVVSATRGGKPSAIIKNGNIGPGGAFMWRVQVPLIVSYTSGRKNDSDQILAVIDVVRVVPSPLNPRGIAVNSINTSHMN